MTIRRGTFTYKLYKFPTMAFGDRLGIKSSFTNSKIVDGIGIDVKKNKINIRLMQHIEYDLVICEK